VAQKSCRCRSDALATDDMDEHDEGEMTDDQKEWIDSAPYKTLLCKWRFGLAGDPMFQGEAGQYYKDVMFRKRDADPEGAVKASKKIGL